MHLATKEAQIKDFSQHGYVYALRTITWHAYVFRIFEITHLACASSCACLNETIRRGR